MLTCLQSESGFYIASARPSPSGTFTAMGVCLDLLGKFKQVGFREDFASLVQAANRANVAVKTKMKKGGYIPVPPQALPEKASCYSLADTMESMSPEQALEEIREAVLERYVWFNDDEADTRFEIHLECFGYEKGSYIKVCDRFGEFVYCHKYRFKKIEKTERALAVEAYNMRKANKLRD
jgi:hypothetical protein